MRFEKEYRKKKRFKKEINRACSHKERLKNLYGIVLTFFAALNNILMSRKLFLSSLLSGALTCQINLLLSMGCAMAKPEGL